MATTSDKSAPKLPPADVGDKEHYPLSTRAAHPAVRKLIDRAALEVDENRAEFILDAAVTRAIEVLGGRVAREILDAATEAAA